MSEIIDILHDAVEAHLPDIRDEARRQQALTYLRGLKVVLATRVAPTPISKVVRIDDYLMRNRVTRAIAESRRSALADARRIHQHGVNEFGDDVYDDID